MDRILIDNPEDNQVIAIDEQSGLARMLVYDRDTGAHPIRMEPAVARAVIKALEKLQCMQGTRPASITIPETAMQHKGWTYWITREDMSQGVKPPIQYYFPRVCRGTDTETLLTLHAEPSHAAAIEAALAYIADWGGLQASLHETPAETDAEGG